MSELNSDSMAALDDDLEEDTMRDRFLVFLLDDQEFAIEIRYVVDIINVQPVTRVPNCPEYIKGITNLRGKVIPIMDVRLRFGKEPKEYNDRTCIIVVEHNNVSVGLIIDKVAEVITMEESIVSPPPSFNLTLESKFIAGIGKTAGGVKLILDCLTVLDDAFVDENNADE